MKKILNNTLKKVNKIIFKFLLAKNYDTNILELKS